MHAEAKRPPTYEELEEKLVILAAENQELTERSEELLLLGSLGESLRSDATERQLIEATLERIGLVKGLELVAYRVTSADGISEQYGYSAIRDDTLSDFFVPPDVEEWLRSPGYHFLSEGTKKGIRIRFRTDPHPLSPTVILVIPVLTKNTTSASLWLVDTSNNDILSGAALAMCRAADMLGARLDNFRLVNELRELNRTLDSIVEQRTTELLTSNQRLRESEERFSQLIVAAGDAIFVVDEQGRIIDANPQAFRSLGYDMSGLIGQSWFDVETTIDESQFNELKLAVSALTEQEGAVTRLGVHRKANGSSFPVEIRISPLAYSNSTSSKLMVLARDTSERLRLEQQLQQSQKMESIGRFAGGIAHDFNNLLTTILGYSEILLTGDFGNSTGREELSQIEAAGRHAAALTQQLLAFSRRQVLDRRQVDLTQVVKEGCKMLRRIIGDDIVVDLRLEATQSNVFADPVQLQQILLNLAVNARDAMPTGGRLVVNVSNVVIDETTANFQPEHTVGEYVVMTVADSGVGMTHDVLEKLFEPFFTTKPAGRGTGLGLSTVYGIVKQHDGHIVVYSELGQGTTFRVFFPVSHTPVDEPRSNSPPLLPQSGTERLLVVDDNDSIRRFLYDGLTHLGYNVITASHGQEALEIITANSTLPFALVLSDVVMPVMNGCELVDQLFETHPELPIILMSGFIDDQIATSSRRVRSTLMLPKPISLLELSQTLRRVITALNTLQYQPTLVADGATAPKQSAD